MVGAVSPHSEVSKHPGPTQAAEVARHGGFHPGEERRSRQLRAPGSRNNCAIFLEILQFERFGEKTSGRIRRRLKHCLNSVRR